MGIVIFPVLVVTVGLIIFSIFDVFALIRHGAFPRKTWLCGIGVAIALYALTLLWYKCDDDIWALGPFFTLPINLVILPYFARFFVAMVVPEQHILFVKNVLTVSIVATFLLAIVFSSAYFDFMDYWGFVIRHY